MKKILTEFSINHPWLVIGIMVAITAFFAAQLPKIKIDTDPENMLKEDEPARVFDHQVKDEFSIYDFIAVGVVAEDGAFNKNLLTNIYNIIEEVEDIDGVIAEDILAPSTVDDIRQGEDGILRVSTLLEDEPKSDEKAQYILSRIKDNPIFRGKLASDDGKAIALFIPIEAKNMSHRIAGEIQEIVDKHSDGEEYFIAGLPVAEDSFGAEMFKQMAISAPLAGAIILLLLLLFFRNLKIVIAPMIVAVTSVIWAMGLLIFTGNTVHIMSSMIPIFLIPIAVLNSIHIISEFHDRYQKHKHKKTTIRNTISDLFIPILFTSITTIVGFLSLALTPIPPVRVFGIFVAFGIFSAWLLSVTFNPAYAVLLSDKSLRNFGRSDDSHGPLAKTMYFFRDFNRKYYKLVLFGAAVVIVVSIIGLNLIEVNDNPVKWFKKDHPLRQADVKLNQHLAGTYMNYLVLDGGEPDALKDPETLKYIEKLQRHLETNRIVGATTGLTDVVKKVRYELFNGDRSKFAIPDDQNEVAQDLFLFEISGGDPDDLFKFVNEDYSKVNLWVQLKEGDNKSVKSVVDDAGKFIADNPPPSELDAHWAGLPYVNIVWQEKMVGGMRSALLSSFIIVFIMMIFLFRSFKLGAISMLPLTITIMAIYGAIGYFGKPYDMPIAVLSSLTLGLSIDFAIHFIKRSKYIHERTGDFKLTYPEMFEGLSRAIGRNVLVIAIGFVPMFFSSLVPYITVGSFFFAIMMISGAVTMLLLPSIFLTFQRQLFPDTVPVVNESRSKVTINK
jgi:predicted RND superfamily exporter protein